MRTWKRRRKVPGYLVIVLAAGACGGGGDGPANSVEPPATGEVRGTVLDDASAGVAGATVQLAGTGAATRSLASTSSGSFAFGSVAPGSWTLDVTAPAGFEKASTQTFPVAVSVTAGQTSTVTLRLTRLAAATGAIAGTVRSGTVGIANATLALTGAASRQGASGSTGGYTFGSLPAGQYTVTITPPAGFALATGETGAKPATVTAGATATVDFSLQPASTTTRTIDVQDYSFSPSTLTIARGTTVRWVSRVETFHTVTPNGHTEWSSAELQGSGTSFEHTFNTPGTYDYYCSPHRALGMTGRIVVQ